MKKKEVRNITILINGRIGYKSINSVYIEGKPLLYYLIKTIKRTGIQEINLISDNEKNDSLLIKKEIKDKIKFNFIKKIKNEITLDLRNIYSPIKLSRLIKRGERDCSSAIIWQIRKEEDIGIAEEDNIRSYGIQ